MNGLLHCRGRFQSTVVMDVSRGGLGLKGAHGVMPEDEVSVELLDGRLLTGSVRWWTAGRCGVALHEPLALDDPLLAGGATVVRKPRQPDDRPLPSAGVATVLRQSSKSAVAPQQSAPARDRPSTGDVRTSLAASWDVLRSMVAARQRRRKAARDKTMMERACREQGFSWLTDEP